MFIHFISITAIITSNIALLPQIYKSYRSRSVNDLSVLMLINFLICSVTWVIYGFYIEDMTVWLTNCISTFFNLTLLCLKIKYHKPND